MLNSTHQLHQGTSGFASEQVQTKKDKKYLLKKIIYNFSISLRGLYIGLIYWEYC